MRRQKMLKLLPNQFKFIGSIVVLFAVITVILLKEKAPLLLPAYKPLVINAVILGLSVIIWSKDKVEDEMILTIRLRAMAGSFVAGVVYVFVAPILDFLFTDPVGIIDAQQVVLYMLIGYLLSYYIQKTAS